MMAGADGAGPHGEAAGFDAGAAQGNGVISGELGGKSCVRESGKDLFGGEPGGSYGGGGADKKFAAVHGYSCLRARSVRAYTKLIAEIAGNGRGGAGIIYSNCLRKAASCSWISETSLLSSKTSFSRWDRRSSADVRGLCVAAECGLRHVDCRRRFAGEQLHVTRFLGSGLTRQNGHERRLSLAEAVERRNDIVETFEAIHAFGATAELSGSLRAAKEKHAEHGDLAAIEIENFLQAVLVLGHAAVGPAGGTGETFFLQRGQGVGDGIFPKSHHRVAIVFLIAGVDQGVER